MSKQVRKILKLGRTLRKGYAKTDKGRLRVQKEYHIPLSNHGPGQRLIRGKGRLDRGRESRRELPFICEVREGRLCVTVVLLEKHDENGVATAGRRTQANPDAVEGIAEPGYGNSASRTTSILKTIVQVLAPVLVLVLVARNRHRCRRRVAVALTHTWPLRTSERDARTVRPSSPSSSFVFPTRCIRRNESEWLHTDSRFWMLIAREFSPMRAFDGAVGATADSQLCVLEASAHFAHLVYHTSLPLSSIKSPPSKTIRDFRSRNMARNFASITTWKYANDCALSSFVHFARFLREALSCRDPSSLARAACFPSPSLSDR